MAKKLKTFVTSLGFFDQAVAAPSMKAALEAWGADSNLFHQGAAKQTEDPDIVAATMAAPGVVLNRPVGSGGAFTQHARLPTSIGEPKKAVAKTVSNKTASKKKPRQAADPAADRRAAAAFEKQERRREQERIKEEAVRRKDNERRRAAVDKAQGALDAARVKHESSAASIRSEIEAAESKLRSEDARWDKERRRLEDALRQAKP
jgi:hypothetical protein